MSPSAGLWVPGIMPIQFLLIPTATFLVFTAIQVILKRIGRPMTPFWQVVGSWLLFYLFLKWAVFPPLPFSVMVTYMGLVTIVLLVWVSATNQTWQEFKRYILDTLTGASLHHRVLRAVVAVMLPIVAGVSTYRYFEPQEIVQPLEFRAYHPAPPRTITVQGQEIDLQTAKNPFRVTK